MYANRQLFRLKQDGFFGGPQIDMELGETWVDNDLDTQTPHVSWFFIPQVLVLEIPKNSHRFT